MSEWIRVKSRYPEYEVPVLCRLKHWFKGTIQEERLIRVDESDCTWRTAGDRCEVSFDWDVVEWLETEVGSVPS